MAPRTSLGCTPRRPSDSFASKPSPTWTIIRHGGAGRRRRSSWKTIPRGLILQEGFRLTNATAYRPWLAQTYVAWADSLARSPKAAVGERLALLEKAIQLDLGNIEALVRLADLIETKDEAYADKARAALRNLLDEGKQPGAVHLLLVMEAQSRDKVEEGRQHYEQAYKPSPQTPIVVNNLAWALAGAGPFRRPDLEQALRLINTALEGMPNQLRFRETRGQILAKMGKYQSAPLVPVLNDFPDCPVNRGPAVFRAAAPTSFLRSRS